MIRLFAYGELKITGFPDLVSAPGDLRQRANGDAAAVFGLEAQDMRRLAGVDDGLVWGQVLTKSEQDIEALDASEKPQFLRVQIRLSDGSLAWAYKYVLPDFVSLSPIVGGVWRSNGNA